MLDELVQVLRHLLTSATCAKDGKRPALLARFPAANTGIAAGALSQMLTSITSRCIICKRCVQKTAAYFLIRNDYQPAGYPVRFIDAPDRGGITLELLQAVDHLPSGQVLYMSPPTARHSRRPLPG